MDTVLIIILVLLLGVALAILYLNLRSRPKNEDENKEAEEIANLKTEIVTLKDTLNNTINTSLGNSLGIIREFARSNIRINKSTLSLSRHFKVSSDINTHSSSSTSMDEI